MEPVAANFKGLKEVRREKTDKYYRYYVGKEVTLDKITEVWQQVKIKFPQSFLVSFSGGKRTIIDNKAKP
jgi:N-acetylmuramoyl-L-alanine amidase